MQRIVVTALFLLAACVMTVAADEPSRVTAQEQEIYVTPTNGNPWTAFFFSGVGFPPGIAISLTFIAPDGSHVGVDDAQIIVQDDGSFGFATIPEVNLGSGAPGRWIAHFVLPDGMTYYDVTFLVWS